MRRHIIRSAFSVLVAFCVVLGACATNLEETRDDGNGHVEPVDPVTNESSPQKIAVHEGITAEEAFRNGDDALEAGAFEQAIEWYTVAIELNPDYVDAYHHRAIAHMQIHHFNDALEDFDRALQYGDDPAILYNLGCAYLQYGFYEPAIMVFEHLLTLTPDDPYVLNNLGLSFAGARRFDEAIAVYSLLIQLRPQMVEAYNNMGSIYQEMKMFLEAIAWFEQALQIDPNYPDALYNLGECHQLLGNASQAVHYYERYLEARPDAPDRAKVTSRIAQLSGSS